MADINLPALLNQVLLHHDENNRYHVHALVRQFAEEKLQAGTTYQATQMRYGTYYLSFLEEERARFNGGNAGKSLTNIESEIDNLRQAWQTAVEKIDLPWLDRAILPLYLFYVNRNWHQEAEQAYGQAITKIEVF